mgnify:CR=1 FL=1
MSHNKSHLSGASAYGDGSTADTANKLATGVSEEFHNFIADIENLIKETTTLTGEDLSRAKEKLTTRLAEAKESVQDVGGAIAQRGRRAATVTNEYVHEQPWKVIGASALIGLLVGFALTRR